jgi:hypothetical protein
MPAAFLAGAKLQKSIIKYAALHGCPDEICASYPHCKEPRAEGFAFCANHHTIFDALAGRTKKEKFNRHDDPPPLIDFPVPPKAPPKPKRDGPPAQDLCVAAILDALSTGPLTPKALRTNIDAPDHIYRRALGKAKDKIVRSGKSGRGFDALYSLPEAVVPLEERQAVDQAKQSNTEA